MVYLQNKVIHIDITEMMKMMSMTMSTSTSSKKIYTIRVLVGDLHVRGRRDRCHAPLPRGALEYRSCAVRNERGLR